jgi:hypothetical protein
VVCCSRCASITALSYSLEGDGDGVEFMIEVADHAPGSSETTVIMFNHSSA